MPLFIGALSMLSGLLLEDQKQLLVFQLLVALFANPLCLSKLDVWLPTVAQVHHQH